MAKQKKALTVKNIHGTFTAPSEEHVQHVLESVGPGSAGPQIIREHILGAYDGTEWAGNVDHFARYSDRTLAIMACDLDVSRIDDGLAYVKRRTAEIKAREEQERAPRVYGSGAVTPANLTDDQIRGLLARIEAEAPRDARSSSASLAGACRLALKGRIYRGSVRRICEAINEYAAAGAPVAPQSEEREPVGRLTISVELHGEAREAIARLEATELVRRIQDALIEEFPYLPIGSIDLVALKRER